mmetsp:Transcript_10749/g.31496  ORF Transcript_10749/g.31496 Transcript_10749/m.31496 type:complete len:226 (-) Transcript_10749:1844-2521(-)
MPPPELRAWLASPGVRAAARAARCSHTQLSWQTQSKPSLRPSATPSAPPPPAAPARPQRPPPPPPPLPPGAQGNSALLQTPAAPQPAQGRLGLERGGGLHLVHRWRRAAASACGAQVVGCRQAPSRDHGRYSQRAREVCGQRVPPHAQAQRVETTTGRSVARRRGVRPPLPALGGGRWRLHSERFPLRGWRCCQTLSVRAARLGGTRATPAEGWPAPWRRQIAGR